MRRYFLSAILFAASVLLLGCEYGDKHGSAARSDITLGLKERPTEIYAFRQGLNDFTGYFILEFPPATAPYFNNPPSTFFGHPKPLSYERNHTFVKWQKTPVAPSHDFLKQRVVSMMKGTGVPEERVTAFLKQADSPGGYYASHYEEIGRGRYDNITFYLLDPSSRKLHEFTDTSSF